MKRLVPVALALVLAVPASTHANEPILAGDVCSWVARTTTSTWSVVVYGGPLAAADLTFVAPDPLQWVVDNPVSVTLTCTLHDAWSARHSDPAVASVSATGAGVAVLAPTVVEVLVGRDLVVCTKASVTDTDGDTFTAYWDGGRTEFTADPNAFCGPAACTTEWPPRGEGACGPSVFDVVDHVEDLTPWGPVDAAVCPVLAGAFPPEGDVADVWDCPPYGS